MKYVILIVALLGVRVASAHPLDLGYVRVSGTSTSVVATLDIDIKAAALLLHRDTVDGAFIAAHATELATASLTGAPITTPSGPCTWGASAATLSDQTVTISSVATCADDGPRHWSFPFLAERRVSTSFELMLKETIGGSERLTLLDTAHASVVLGARDGSTDTAITSFLWSGIEHIGAAPSEWRDGSGGLQLPDGIDHILFLLGLMLGGGALLRLLGSVTGFTVGHSITLGLATLGVVHPPGWLIEPLIALSIAFVAFEAMTARLERYRWKIALGFGLVHGFGFANALTEMNLSAGAKAKALVGYNLGVELGQLAIVLLLAPIVLAAHRRRWSRRWVLGPAAIAIGIAGLYWFVQRAF